jgi:hypothetical protein
LFSDLELDRSAGFLLNNGSVVPHLAPDEHVIYPEPHEVTAPQLTIDGKIEQSEVASALLKLEPNRIAQTSFGFRGRFGQLCGLCSRELWQSR